MNFANGQRASLRRLDWRFLLPVSQQGSFQHLVLLGGQPYMAERLVELGVARRVSRSIPNKPCADALVILHNARVVLKDVLNCLAPGGVLYYEIDRGSPLSLAWTPAWIRRTLRRAGLSPTGIYAVKPNFESCELFLPMEATGALRWYVTSLYTAATPTGRLLESGLRTFTGLNNRRFATIAPYYAVTAIAGGVRKPMPTILENSALPGEIKETKFYPLMLTDGSNRVTLLPFAIDGRCPAAVLKIPRLPGFNSKTENEQKTLHEIRSRLDPAIYRTVPRPLGIVRFGEISIGIETYAEGSSLLRSTGGWGKSMNEKIDDLRLAAQWLGEFHHQTQVFRRPWTATEASHWVEDTLATYTQRFGRRADEQRLFAAVRRRATFLIGTPLPTVWQHRDFNVWNIFRSGRELTVIDWEGGRLGPPLCDLLHFVTHWHEVAHGLRTETAQVQAFRQLFFGPRHGGTPAHAVHETIAQYMERLNLDPGFLPLLLVYTWVELALRRFDQQREMGELEADARSGNRNLAFIGVLAEHAKQLFEITPSAPLAAIGAGQFSDTRRSIAF